MKKIIFGLAFIYCVLCRAYNVKEREGYSCDEYYLIEGIEGKLSASTCVDLGLESIIYENYYYDKCCFVRLRINGYMLSECFGIFRDEFMDVPELIESIEKESPYMKIYEFNCNSSYLKSLALFFALFSLLF